MAILERQHAAVDSLGRNLHDLRISVTDKCNLRCTYCMPAEHYHEQYAFLPKEDLLTFEEIARVAQSFVILGVRKLRITGGEPLLRKNLPVLVAMLRQVNSIEDLALTTNGILLPQHAEALRSAGLNRVTISLDSLDDETFGRTNGRGVPTAPVWEGIAAAERVGLTPIKINIVVQRGVNDGSLVEFAARFRGTGHIVRFIEYMDVGTCNGWKRDQVVPTREIRDRIAARFPLEPLDSKYHGEVAERYRYVDGEGEVGFISSVTQPFCGSCTRARLSADGHLFTCLFASSGKDLRGLLRAGISAEGLREAIENVWNIRDDRYSELRAQRLPGACSDKKIEMYQIGG